MTISAASAPTSLAACRYSIACATLLLPQPAITGTRPLRDFDRELDHPALLVGAHRRAFAGRSARDQRVAALGDLPLDELAECVFGDTAARKWRHERRDRPEKHELTSVHGSLLCVQYGPRSRA